MPGPERRFMAVLLGVLMVAKMCIRDSHQDHRAYEDLSRRQRPQRRRTLSTGNDRR